MVVCLPADPGTDRLIDARVFSAMKPGAYFYNIGRGQVVDEAALLRTCKRVTWLARGWTFLLMSHSGGQPFLATA